MKLREINCGGRCSKSEQVVSFSESDSYVVLVVRKFWRKWFIPEMDLGSSEILSQEDPRRSALLSLFKSPGA